LFHAYFATNQMMLPIR